MLTQIVAGLAMLSVLVVVHEFGHFVVARIFGVGVPVFSVGMGPRIAGFSWRGTDFRLSALPVGGYVQMAGADPFGGEDIDAWVPPERDFMKKPVWQRLLIMAAGPAFNLALPFVVFTAVLMAGEPQPDNTIGLVHHGSVAAELGIAAGDRIVAVDGRPTDTWTEVALALETDVDDAVTLTVARGTERFEVAIPSDALEYTHEGWADLGALGMSWRRLSSRIGVEDPASPAGRAGVRTGDGIVAVDGTEVETWDALQEALATGDTHELRIRRAVDGEISEHSVTIVVDPSWSPRPEDRWSGRWGLQPIMLFVRGFTEDSAAREAGVRLDDRLLAVDGTLVHGWWDLVDLVGAAAPPPTENVATGCSDQPAPDVVARTLTLQVVRDGAVVDLAFQPRMRREVVRTLIYWRPLIGVVQDPNAYVRGDFVQKRYGLSRAASRATEEVREVFSGTMTILGQMFTGQRKMKEAIGGPVAIFAMAGASRSWFEFVRLMGGISIGLGIVNLLPVPVLDGGQIVFYAIEGIRGRPLSLRLRERIQMIGVLFLVALVLVVTFNDLTGVLGG